MKRLALTCLAALAISCGSSTEPGNGAFLGTWQLAMVGTTVVPGRIYTLSNGAYAIMLSGSMSFLEPGQVSIATTSETHASATASGVIGSSIVRYDLHIIGDSALALQPIGAVFDTIASIARTGERLRVTYRRSGTFGDYQFAR